MGVSSHNILLAGATGLVGGLTLRRLLERPRYNGTIFAPTRHAPDIVDPRLLVLKSKLSTEAGDAKLAELIRHNPAHRLDAFVCCLGTTIKAAGSREAFIAVDRELVLRMARMALNQGARHAVLVSSVGASRQSGNFYLRVKGEVEDALEDLGFKRLDIMQPGLLLGKREGRRPKEAVARFAAPVVNHLMIGKLRRYRAIPADTVAHAIVRLLAREAAGQYTHRYDEIQSLVSRHH